MPPLTLTLRPTMSALPPPANGGVYTLDELLAPHADLLASLALPYAELEYHSVPYGAGNALEPDGMAAHTSKLGGVPFTPAGHPWPRTGRDGDGTPYHFVAQVNFAEAPPLPGFPSAGILQVFSDFTGQDWDDSNGLVRYLGPALAQAPQVLSPPMDEEHREEYEETDPVSSPARISYRAGVSAGGASDAGFLAALKAVGLDTEEWWGDERFKAAQSELYDRYFAGGPRLGGHAHFIGDDPRGDWSHEDVHVLQIDSRGHVNFGDAGHVHVLIPPEALAAGNWGEAYYHWADH